MHLYAFIATLVPKSVAMVTSLCSLYTGVSQMNSMIAQTPSQNQVPYGYVAIFLPILANIWPPWQHP